MENDTWGALVLRCMSSSLKGCSNYLLVAPRSLIRVLCFLLFPKGLETCPEGLSPEAFSPSNQPDGSCRKWPAKWQSQGSVDSWGLSRVEGLWGSSCLSFLSYSELYLMGFPVWSGNNQTRQILHRINRKLPWKEARMKMSLWERR